MMTIRKTYQAALAAAVLLAASGAQAQDRPGLLDNLFNRGEPSQSQQAPAQSNDSDMAVRLDRMENRLREMTGQIEQLQFRNQQLEQEIARLGGAAPAAAPQRSGAPMSAPMAAPAMPQQSMPQQAMPAPTNGKRSDVFDPSQNPGAPGAPRALGGGGTLPAVGAPGAAASGAPLDLSGGNGMGANMSNMPQTQTASADPNAALPAPPPRNTSRTGPQLATLPPSTSPKDEYELAYGYVLHKDYALAEKAFSDFIKRNPGDALVPEANYWLGESYFQRQKYQDAADAYLVVVRNYEKSDKAPDSMLRLGQSLVAIGQKEMACASLSEVNRKYPRASASVKRGVAAEQKRAHC